MDSIDILTGRLTAAGQKAADDGPEIEQGLPMMSDECCTTWGCPFHENIVGILQTVREKGFAYFVIDCGWYREDDIPWDISMGDYNISKILFPGGLEQTVKVIKEAGLKPGIWSEIENVGKASMAYRVEEYLLHLDDKVLTTTRRKFWDMNGPWVEEHLSERMIGILKRYGFEHMKIDYNDTIRMDCDGTGSIGEGLRKNVEKTYGFLDKIKREIPNIVLENCVSDGHKLEPRFMASTSMASFSDTHECEEIPIIAASLHRAILSGQSQIRAMIREQDSGKQIACSMINTFFGKLCLSRDVTRLTESQWEVIDRGMEFYKKLVPIIRHGQSYRFGPAVDSIRHPKGWQAVVRVERDGGQACVILHTFNGSPPERISIDLPQGYPETVQDIYSGTGETVTVEQGCLCRIPSDNRKAVAALLGM